MDVDLSKNLTMNEPSELAKLSRIDILRMCHLANAPHCGSCLSVIDILSVLYSDKDRVKKIKEMSDNRDIIILSKGHAAAALIATLKNSGIQPKIDLNTYLQNGSKLGGHATKNMVGVEFSTGSLGHGLPIGLGVAIARKLSRKMGKVFVVMSDGELNEGTTWESALIANHFALDNLIIIIDRNRLQSLKSTEDTIALEPLAYKWRSFGFEVLDVDGHSFSKLIDAINADSSKPKVIIANTIKGKGVSYMESSILWHYRAPNKDELAIALKEISNS